ncbi:MAG TPA: hypothetical protein P5543_05595 [Planctomycetota bacterium]|nr:hypothetical protein [Planctomycetota bacterium]HRU51647.1 hypothetical protein [Planctomycetota bacterium]
MKKIFILFCCFFLCCGLYAQQLPLPLPLPLEKKIENMWLKPTYNQIIELLDTRVQINLYELPQRFFPKVPASTVLQDYLNKIYIIKLKYIQRKKQCPKQKFFSYEYEYIIKKNGRKQCSILYFYISKTDKIETIQEVAKMKEQY